MNPSGTSRPVMDVSAPRPMAQPVATEPVAVRPAPIAAQIPTRPQAQTPISTEPTPKAKPVKTHQEPTRPRTGAPVGVITIAVLAMMLLSAAAVVVYATSQTA